MQKIHLEMTYDEKQNTSILSRYFSHEEMFIYSDLCFV